MNDTRIEALEKQVKELSVDLALTKNTLVELVSKHNALIAILSAQRDQLQPLGTIQ